MNSVGNKNTKHTVWNALKTGVFGSLLTVAIASAWTFAQEAPQKSGTSPEQQKRLDVLKSKGPEASLTILPLRLVIGGKPMDVATERGRGFRDRVTEVVGLFLEQKGLKNIDLGKTAFEPATTADLTSLAGSLTEFVKQHPIATEYVLFAELRTDGISTMLADKTGALVWSDRLTAQDEPFKSGPPEPMVICDLLTKRLSPQFGLNEKTRKAAKPGKMAAIMAERSGQPPENERTPLPGRHAAMKKAVPNATWVVLGVRARVAEEAATGAGAADLASLINGAGLCKAEPAKQALLLKASQADPNEMKVLWDLAREFRDYAKKNPVDADYVLYADYRFNPQRWQAGFVHFVVCDRQGEWVLVDMQNSHHPDYQSIKPTSREDCDKLLLKRLEHHLR
jgi:hypothetical protein